MTCCLLEEKNADKPLMQRYLDSYFDLFWDLHLGVRGDDIPEGVRRFLGGLLPCAWSVPGVRETCTILEFGGKTRRADPRPNTVQDNRDIRSGNPKAETTGSETAIEAARMRTLSIASESGKPAERAKNILRLHALAEIGVDKSCLNDAIAPY